MYSVDSTLGSPFTEYWDVIDLVGPVEDTTEDTIEEKMTEFFGNAMGSSIVCITIFSVSHQCVLIYGPY